MALQVNNWKESKNEKSQFKLYLSGLVEALNDDIEFLQYTKSGYIFRSECLAQFLFWSTGEYPKYVFGLNSQIDSSIIYNKPGITWNIIWHAPIPSEYNREFKEECFKRSSFGNIIVVNRSTLDEFKNTGLFSFINNEELKRQISNYYASMNWHFSDWRETIFRKEIDEWEDFMRDNYQINTSDISRIINPIELIRDHRDIQLEMEELVVDAIERANSAGDIKITATELIQEIEKEISKL